jgi:hypothetical protein
MTDHDIEAFVRHLREHPALLARIQAGELSAEAAAEAAGFNLGDSEVTPLDGTDLEDSLLESVAGGTTEDPPPSTKIMSNIRGRLICVG